VGKSHIEAHFGKEIKMSVLALRKLVDELEVAEARCDELRSQISQASGNGAVATQSSKRGRPAVKVAKIAGTGKRGRPPGTKNKPKDGEAPKAPKVDASKKKRGRPAKAAADKPVKTGGRENSLWSYVQKVLKTHKSGMTLDKLAEAVIAQGYKTKSENFGTVLYQTLNKQVKNKDLKRDEDKYLLSEAA
jgi:hypothetical protein